MPSIAVRREFQAVSAATALGVLTVASTADLYSGAYAWVSLNNQSASVRVKILKIITATTLLVRKMPVKKDNGTNYTTETVGPPGYGVSDMTAYNGNSFISMEAQTVPVDPAFAKRSVP